MANILLTQRCTRSCPYCFAVRHMESSPPDDILCWEDLIYLVDLEQEAGSKRIQFLGGEPSLHPEFLDFCLYAIGRGLGVTVFTNGAWPEALLDEARHHFARLPDDRLSFVVNVNHPSITADEERARTEAFLACFGSRITPGFNIYQLDFDITFIFDYINRFGLKRGIRLGLTHPIPGVNNRFIAVSDLKPMAAKLLSFGNLFEENRVQPLPDCGFPLCLFSDEELGWLYRMNGNSIQFSCAPVIDIGPDLRVWSCFPLSAHHARSVYEFDSLEEIYRYYELRHQTIRVEVAGIYPECDDCRHREAGVCAGGCAAHTLSNFVGEARVRLPEFYP